MTLKLVRVKRVKDAIGAYCLSCHRTFYGYHPWHWRKSQALHEKGTGHKVVMVTHKETAA